MQKEIPFFRFAVLAFCALSFFGLRAYGQEKEQETVHPNGIVQDWSHRHVIYPRFGPIQSLIALQNDPRAISAWQASARQEWHRAKDPWHFRGLRQGFHRDWSLSLGGGTLGKSMYPAKYTFDPNATPTCKITGGVPIPDFIVYTVNVAGSSSQPNVVGLQDLYSGTAGTTGICNSQRPSYFSGGNTAAAAAFFSYNITAADGVNATSPALSIDGTKIAFVEKGLGTNAHFHVLAYNGGTAVAAGDGVQTTNSSNLLLPKTITTFSSVAPAAGSGTVTDLSLGSASDTLSSPFIDYAHDMAYVGNDAGVLFRILNVFCTISTCTPGTSPAPVLDASWGSGGALSTGCSGELTGAVVAGTGNIFVGCSDGNLYGFTPTGTPLSGSPLAVGQGGANGGITDPPLVDVVHGFVYEVSMRGSATLGVGAGTPVLVQASATDLSSPVAATLGVGANFDLHAPTFNNAYLGGAGTPLIYEVTASTVAGGSFDLYGVAVDGTTHVMTSGTPTNKLHFTFGQFEFSPIAQFFDGVQDRIFESSVLTPASGASLASFRVDTGFPVSTTPEHVVSSGGGTTGIVVDNNDTVDGQADSIYFGVLPPNNTAEKLTQTSFN